MARYSIHAGHNSKVPGANGIFREEVEARKVKNEVIKLLKEQGHTVYDDTDDAGATQTQNLNNICKKVNSHTVDLAVSIHFNAFNKTAKGVEVLNYDTGTKAISDRICKEIATLGFVNRGTKYNRGLAVLNGTKWPALLVECCFCDNAEDAKRYNASAMAKAIVEGILNKKLTPPAPAEPTSGFRYRGHSKNIGWGKYESSGGTAGTTGKGLQMEALQIDPDGLNLEASYHSENVGWVTLGKITKDTIIGTVGKGLSLQALRINGNIEIRVHIAGTGWTNWTKCDGVITVGTVGKGVPIEAVQIRKL